MAQIIKKQFVHIVVEWWLGVLVAKCIPILLTGYIRGTVRFFQCDFEPSYKAEIVYGIGMVTGLNCFIGFFDLGEFAEKKKVEKTEDEIFNDKIKRISDSVIQSETKKNKI